MNLIKYQVRTERTCNSDYRGVPMVGTAKTSVDTMSTHKSTVPTDGTVK